MFSRRSWRWLAPVLLLGVGLLVMWQSRSGRRKVNVQFEHWEADGDTVLAITNGTHRQISISSHNPITLYRSYFASDGSFSHSIGCDLEPGESGKLHVFFKGRPLTIQFYIHPWAEKEAEEAKDRYNKLPKLISDWFMRR